MLSENIHVRGLASVQELYDSYTLTEVTDLNMFVFRSLRWDRIQNFDSFDIYGQQLSLSVGVLNQVALCVHAFSESCVSL